MALLIVKTDGLRPPIECDRIEISTDKDGDAIVNLYREERYLNTFLLVEVRSIEDGEGTKYWIW